jgi:hypothetical protein
MLLTEVWGKIFERRLFLRLLAEHRLSLIELLEPIQKLVESDESDVIPLRGAWFEGSCHVEAW